MTAKDSSDTDDCWCAQFSYMEHLTIFSKNSECSSEELKKITKKFEQVLECLTPLKVFFFTIWSCDLLRKHIKISLRFIQIALETIAMEPYPVASLVRPLVQQLFDNYFDVDRLDHTNEQSVIHHCVREELQM